MTSLLAGDNGLRLDTEADALDLLASGLPACILTPEDLHPQFFDLSSGLAGAVLQKFVNYQFNVAIVLPANHGYGERVTELVRDHQRHPCVRFFHSVAAARDWLARVLDPN